MGYLGGALPEFETFLMQLVRILISLFWVDSWPKFWDIYLLQALKPRSFIFLRQRIWEFHQFFSKWTLYLAFRSIQMISVIDSVLSVIAWPTPKMASFCLSFLNRVITDWQSMQNRKHHLCTLRTEFVFLKTSKHEHILEHIQKF